MKKRLLALLLAGVLIVTSLSVTAFAATEPADEPLTATEEAVPDGDSYYYYKLAHKDAEVVTGEKIDLDIYKAKLEDANIENYLDEDAIMLYQTGKATFTFNVKKEGFYAINTRYAAIAGKPIDMEICVSVDGEVPYTEATTVSYSRNYKDKYEEDENGNFPKRDSQDNQITPDTEEVFRYTDYVVHDNDYMTDADLMFYFSAGKHTLTFEATRESLAFSKVWLGYEESKTTYEEYISEYASASKYAESVNLHAEMCKERSDQMLGMANDNANASTVPSDPSKNRLNTVGGESWKDPGQWISWEVEAPADGLYALTFKYRQDYVSGFKVYREISVDGEVPFDELSCVSFAPTSTWKNMTVADAEGNPYYIYLTEGTHEIKLNVVLGPVADSLQRISNAIADLNKLYRDIIGVTGPTPDSNRDYDIDRVIPGLMENFERIDNDLKQVAAEVVEYNGVKGGLSSFIDVMTKQIDDFIKDPLDITDELEGFKSNIASLADMMSDMKSQAMILDELYIGEPEKAPSPKVGFMESTSFMLKGFFLSFVSDYNAKSDADVDYKIDEPIEVWISAGHDQLNILKNMIDDQFVANSHIPVNLSLVDVGAALTKAILAGAGPDCAMTVGGVVTYSMRGIVEDMDQFNAENQLDENGEKKYTYTFDEVKEWFYPSAFIPAEYMDGKTYGLPETQTYNMLFVRDDIFKDLGLEIPQTWNDVYASIATIERNNMMIGIPAADLTMFYNILYENGGSVYLDDFSGVNFNTQEAIDAFTQWTEFNTKYSLPLTYDALNRFRSGEMPIQIANYSFFNNLEVGAPEIKGLWSMYQIPGVLKEDGSIDRTQTGGSVYSIMVKGCDNKEAVWEFMSWWVGEEAQGTFGQKIEARLGAAGRYATANVAALDQIPWSVNQQVALKEAWSTVTAVPEVPGNYYVIRMINNAFRAVVYKGYNERETLLKYSKEMDTEIQRKRNEYGIEQVMKDNGLL